MIAQVLGGQHDQVGVLVTRYFAVARAVAAWDYPLFVEEVLAALPK